jgi:hypothetical protein
LFSRSADLRRRQGDSCRMARSMFAIDSMAIQSRGDQMRCKRRSLLTSSTTSSRPFLS